MRILKALFIVAVIGFALWAGLWFFGYRQATNETTALLSNNQDIHAESFEISGFPSRYDTEFSNLSVKGDGFTWQTRAANIYRLPYQSAHYVMALPAEQVFESDKGKLILYAPEMKASVDLNHDNRDAIDELIIETSRLQAAGEFAGLTFNDTSLDRGLVALRRDGESETDYLTYAKFENLRFGAFQPRSFEIDGRTVLSHPPQVYPNPRPHATAVDFTSVKVELEQSIITGHGDLALNTNDQYDGVLHLTWMNWQAEIDAIAAHFGLDGLASRILGELFQDKASGALVFDVYVEDGAAKIGPFSLGILPTIKI